MSAAVCRSNKRPFFEDIPSSSPPSYISKRLCLRRCLPSSPSPAVRFSPPPQPQQRSPLDRLQPLFPHVDPELLERALVECGNDIDTAIKRLQQLCLGAVEEPRTSVEQGAMTNDGEASAALPLQNPTTVTVNLPVDGAEWVDLFVKEMTNATSLDDAKLRASRLLEALGKSIGKAAAAAQEAAQSSTLHKENIMLKQQNEELVQSNTVLKRAVVIQHERQKDYDKKENELQHLKQQLVSQYKEQLRTLEVNNYALTMHLRQAQQSTSIPGRFHPDVF